jgi:uncharacterized protein YjlB
MERRGVYAVLAVAAALATSSAQAEMVGKYTLVSALPRPGATQILDNNRGTVWDVIYPPGMSTGMHRHPTDFVGIELVETMLKVTTPDGQDHINPVHRGQIYMLPKGLTHIEENVIGHPQRNSILIELKDGGPQDYPNNGQAPAGFAADGAKKVTDNARVALWDATWKPGAAGKSFFQSHDLFLVPMDVGTLSITGDEPAKTLPVAGGQVVFLPGGHTRAIQSTDGTVRAAIVELK